MKRVSNMYKYIYKITNKKNGHVYIGQSKNPEKRFKNHYGQYSKTYSVLNTVINKYGKENFLFEIIEGPIENYNEREKYWIKYYHSYVQDPLYNGGYNMSPGGEEPPILKGEDNPGSLHTLQQVNFAKRLLKETTLSPNTIATLCEYQDRSGIDRINSGQIWNDPNETYPLRPYFFSKNETQKRWEKITDLLANTDLTQKEIGKLCNCGRSCVTMINIGQNGKEYNNGKYSYPIRKKSITQKEAYQRAKQVAEDLANTPLSYKELREKYDCSHSYLSEINQGKNYNFIEYTYPIRKYYNNPVETISGETESTLAIDTQVEMGS